MPLATQRLGRATAALTVLASSCLGQSQPGTAKEAEKPSFIFILGEANGWANNSVLSDDRLPASRSAQSWTPNLERLAREGMRFSDFYAPSPRCTPSRASFLSGVSPARLHMTYINQTGLEDGGGPRMQQNNRPRPAVSHKLVPPAPIIELPRDVTTVAELLKAEGYATAHFGKWHVGRVSPAQHGFEESDGANGNEGPDRDGPPNPRQAYALTEKGIAFIEKHTQAKTPFFLQLSHYPGRTADEATPETRKELEARFGPRRGRQAEQAAIIADMDKTIGNVLRKLDDLGIAKRTYVIYSADHGAQGDGQNAPLRGGKGSVREGGIRVPFIVRGPGVKPDAGSQVRGIGWDLLPTVAELAGTRRPLPPEVEGGSLASTLLAGGTGRVRRPREEIVVHFPHYDLNNGGPASALYLNEFKLIRSYETGTSSLYNISQDPTELKDLAAEMPERVTALDSRLAAYLKAVNAQIPAPRPSTQTQ